MAGASPVLLSALLTKFRVGIKSFPQGQHEEEKITVSLEKRHGAFQGPGFLPGCAGGVVGRMTAEPRGPPAAEGAARLPLRLAGAARGRAERAAEGPAAAFLSARPAPRPAGTLSPRVQRENGPPRALNECTDASVEAELAAFCKQGQDGFAETQVGLTFFSAPLWRLPLLLRSLREYFSFG